MFNISINTLLGSPQKLICQYCGMPLDDDTMLEELIDFLSLHMSDDSWSFEQTRAFFEEQLPKLNYWKDKK